MQNEELAKSSWTFDTIYTHLTRHYGYPVLPPPSPYPHESDLSHAITSLSLHPTLEAILHILNADLASAHFLCRHFQNKPAWEGMYIHGLLHRVEGDYENTKIWYRQVSESGSGCFKHIWGSDESVLDTVNAFLDGVKMLRDETPHDEDLMRRLRESSKREFDSLVEWCKQQFGTAEVQDAKAVAWVEPSEEEREIAAKMIVGGEGWRQF